MITRLYLALAVSNLSVLSQTCQKMSSYTPEAQMHSIAFVTTPNDTVAKNIAKELVTQKLAACVNIVPQITSIYEWEGEINEDSEVLMMIKTRTSRIPELTEFVRNNHPYKVCEVISTKIDGGNQPYLDWISKTVPDVPKS